MLPASKHTRLLRFCCHPLRLLVSCAGVAQVFKQHKKCIFKTGPCRSREDAIEDTRTMQAAAAAVQQGIRKCMATASTMRIELVDILPTKARKHIR